MNIAVFHNLCTILASTHRTTDYIPRIRTSSARYPTMHSTMPISSDSERSSLRPSFATSPPSPCPRADSVRPPKAYLSPDSSPPVRKTEFAKIYDLLLRLSESESVEEDIQNKFTVSPADWLELQDEIFLKGEKVSSDTRAWANEKLRFNYDAEEETFEIKMADAIHERCKMKLIKLITRGLAAHSASTTTGLPPNVSTDDIESWAHSRTKLALGSERSADVTFALGQQFPPTFIAEIGNSQNGEKKFAARAVQWIRGTNGLTKTMLGIDIEYRKEPQRQNVNALPRWASYQFFRSSIAGNDLSISAVPAKPVKFKDANGVINPNNVLPFTLDDFVLSNDPRLANHSLNITHQDLYNMMVFAEASQNAVDAYVRPSVLLNYVDTAPPSPEPENDSSSPARNTEDDSPFPGRKSRTTSDDTTSVSTRGSKRKRLSAGGETSEEAGKDTVDEDATEGSVQEVEQLIEREAEEDEEDGDEDEEDGDEDEEDGDEDDEDDDKEARPNKRRR